MRPFEQFDYMECEGLAVVERGDILNVTYFCYPDGTNKGSRFVHGSIDVNKNLSAKELIESFVKEQRKVFTEMTECLNKGVNTNETI